MVRSFFSTYMGILFICVLLLSGFQESVANGTERIHCRGGITNFFKKISQHDTIRIAYFGGSITAAAGWRVKSFNWLKETYPKCHFVEINAALGGTGSDLGAFRLANDVLKHKPDLVFVEFAVNDFSTPKEKIEKQFEGIVRQIWEHDSETDICFVYTIMQKMLENYNNGGRSASVEAAEQIAEVYKIPTLNFAYEVIEQLACKEIIFKGAEGKTGEVPGFSPDGVHPYANTGHEIYFSEFKKFFGKLYISNKKARVHKLPKPLHIDNWLEARYLENDKLTFDGNWNNDFSKSLFETSAVGASVNFTFRGTMLGLADVIGPQGCKLDILIDGKEYTKLRFDKYCTYNRTNYLFISDLEKGIHEVQIKLASLLSVKEKTEILKVRTPDAKSFPENMEKNIFRLEKIMVL
jgi:lysophospholipase L1-like esterase